ncbi:unnamed protein product, partial [Notodromas monacha]
PFGVDVRQLIETICCRKNAAVENLKTYYRQLYHVDLEEDLRNSLICDAKNLVFSIAFGIREETAHVDSGRVLQDARAMNAVGVGRFSSLQEFGFIEILRRRSFPHMKELFQYYQRLTNQSIEDAIKSECSGQYEAFLLTTVAMIRDKASHFAERLHDALRVAMIRDEASHFAERLHDALRGLITDDSTITRIVVSRNESPTIVQSQIDLDDVKRRYRNKFNAILEEKVGRELYGEYKRAVVRILDNN